MEPNEDRVHLAHNNMFLKTFSDPENVRVFLNIALPEPLREAIDLTEMEIEFTSYISDRLKGAGSDIVVKTAIKTEEQGRSPADIYILMEHKSYQDDKSLIQVLKYMYLEWQKDVDQKKPLRVIIPLIFYHGEKNWKVPRSFVDNFSVSDTLKKFLLNFSYVFFDTKDWDFMAVANQELKNNVFLLTALVLMKNASNDNMEIVQEILKFWHEKGFTTEKEKITAFLVYISEIRDIKLDTLKKILEESKIEGGEFMPSLAQRLRDEGKEHWMKQGIEIGEARAERRGLEKIARKLLLMGMDIEKIADATGLTKEEIDQLYPTTH